MKTTATGCILKIHVHRLNMDFKKHNLKSTQNDFRFFCVCAGDGESGNGGSVTVEL